MKPRLLAYLACPACGSELGLAEARPDGDEILEGSLGCAPCRRTYPIRGGIPRFVGDLAESEQRSADAFAYEWQRYSELAGRYRQQFLDWLRPIEADFFGGKAVLEGGCGKGRHTALAAGFGARDVVALDLGAAAEVAYRNTRALPNAHVIQADLHHPPVKPVFDYAFSVGVLHHLPDPGRGFDALVSRVRPGGAVSAWVYGREGNGWIVHLVSPLREHVTARLPHPVLDRIAGALAVPLFLATRLVYRPVARRLGARVLPYGEYLSYIGQFPYREQRSIVFDHLAAPIAHYVSQAEFAGWFQRLGLEEVVIGRHNGNSWSGFARQPLAPSAACAAS